MGDITLCDVVLFCQVCHRCGRAINERLIPGQGFDQGLANRMDRDVVGEYGGPVFVRDYQFGFDPASFEINRVWCKYSNDPYDIVIRQYY